MSKEKAKNRKPLVNYLGGKWRVAPLIWKGFGEINRFVDPFAGSGSTFFCRPHHVDEYCKDVVLGDADGLVTNYLRTVQANSQWLHEKFKEYWDHNEWRHQTAKQMTYDCDKEALKKNLMSSLEWHDRELGLAWLLAMSASIGIQFGYKKTGSASKPERLLEWDYPGNLAIRNGDWSRCVRKSFTYVYSGNKTKAGVVLDPPYKGEVHNYGEVKGCAATDSYDWAVENASERLRVAYCCYEDHFPCPEGWKVVTWSGSTFHHGKNRRESKKRKEVIYFSPHSELPEDLSK